MNRSPLGRLGGAILFLLWAQVATANALPCGLSCLMGEEVVQHHHETGTDDHVIGHHQAGPKVSAPEYCGTPQLLVATVLPADFPVPPQIEVAVADAEQIAPVALASTVLEFATPPPRA